MLIDRFDDLQKEFPHKLAVSYRGKSWSYLDLWTLRQRAIRNLSDLKLLPGSIIAAHLANSPENLSFFLACSALQLAYFPIDSRFTTAEIHRLVQQLKPALWLSRSSLSEGHSYSIKMEPIENPHLIKDLFEE